MWRSFALSPCRGGPVSAQLSVPTLLGRKQVAGCSKSHLHRLDTVTHPSFRYSSPRLASTRAAEIVPLSDAERRTIYALSTPPGKAGVGVIRVSGPDALEVWKEMVKTRKNVTSPDTWRMYRCRIVHPEIGNELDSGLAVFFRGPKSFTTEDVLELHIHSGRAITFSVLSALSCLPFCRPAEAGEFTMRAFVNGRMDLTQVEGLKDLIDADTEIQQRVALRAAGGEVRAQFEHLRTQIIKCLSLVEALIDFGEGEDIEDGVYEQARERARTLLDTIRSHLDDSRRGEVMRSGIRLTIFGPPNAGKSSLLNFLAQREAAIVTPVPGTTRDILELSLDIGGLPVIVSDTAGLRNDTDDMVELIGIERAEEKIRASDVSLCVLDMKDAIVNEGSSATIQVPLYLQRFFTPSTLVLVNKLDLDSEVPSRFSTSMDNRIWFASLKTGQETLTFMNNLSSALKEQFNLDDGASPQAAPLVTRARHRTHLESASQFLEAFLNTRDVVIGAEELRHAAQAIGKVSGLIDTEEILDAVFRDFCIGK